MALLQKKSPMDSWVDSVYREYSEKIYSFILYKLRCENLDTSRAEDVLHETFALLFERALELQAHTNIGGWLYIVATNLCKNEIRRQQRQHLHEQPFHAETTSFDQEFFENITIEVLRSSLSSDDRVLFTRHFIEGMPLQELSCELNVQIGTLKVRTHRLRKRLKKIYPAM